MTDVRKQVNPLIYVLVFVVISVVLLGALIVLSPKTDVPTATPTPPAATEESGFGGLE